MQLTLLIPGLLGPVAGSLPPELTLPELSKLLSHSRFSPAGNDYLHTLFEQFRCDGEGALPVAAASYAFDAPAGTAQSDGYLLRADPVHLRAELSGLFLFDNRMLNVQPDEAGALIEVINAEYGSEGIRLEVGSGERWYLQLPHAPGLETIALEQMVGLDINNALPRGSEAARWHRWLNEVQMMIHDHPVNHRREAEGRPTINSLWLWGGGAVPNPQPRFNGVWSSCSVARGLARLASVADQPLPESFDIWYQQIAGGGHQLIAIDSLRGAVRYGDGEEWLEQLLQIEGQWLRPLAARVASGEIERVTLDSCGAGRFTIGRSDHWHFWRRTKPFADWLQQRI